MTKNNSFTRSLAACISAMTLLALLPLGAHAQNRFLVPSATQVDGNAAWVTIDSASAENMFNFDRALKLEGLMVTGPDGNPVAVENQFSGQTRSSFDVKVGKPGTYKVSATTETVRALYRLPPGSPNTPVAAPGGRSPGPGGAPGGEAGKAGPGGPGGPGAPGGQAGLIRQEFSGEAFKTVKLPSDAMNLRVTKTQTRMETFITNDRASNTVFKPTGVGLELAPVTHPNEIAVKQKTTLRMLLNGKPIANLPITLTPNGARYRGVLKQIRAVTDEQGQFSFTVSEGGVYWLSTSYPVRTAPTEPGAGGPPTQPPVVANAAPIYEDAYTYGAALEVLY